MGTLPAAFESVNERGLCRPAATEFRGTSALRARRSGRERFGTETMKGEMAMNEHLPQVGAPDPELKNSLVLDEFESDEHAGPRDTDVEQGACYFNGREYPVGTYVQSGSEILQCTERGAWIRKGERETSPVRPLHARGA